MLAKLARQVLPKTWRPIGHLTHLVRSRTKSQVQDGPFAGMRYIQEAIGSAYIPKLLGMYERELNPYIEKICQLDTSHIIDIGAGEGYYAVGIAYRDPAKCVIAFEMEQEGRQSITDMARLNAVTDRVEILGKCELGDLAKALSHSQTPVVICDVEGYELNLLDPDKLALLQKAYILVELHDFIHPGLTETLRDRFSATHKIEHIWQTERHRSEFPYSNIYTKCLPTSYLDWAVSEWRPEKMAWFWMEPKA
jgi:hypothetical protein